MGGSMMLLHMARQSDNNLHQASGGTPASNQASSLTARAGAARYRRAWRRSAGGAPRVAPRRLHPAGNGPSRPRTPRRPTGSELTVPEPPLGQAARTVSAQRRVAAPSRSCRQPDGPEHPVEMSEERLCWGTSSPRHLLPSCSSRAVALHVWRACGHGSKVVGTEYPRP